MKKALVGTEGRRKMMPEAKSKHWKLRDRDKMTPKAEPETKKSRKKKPLSTNCVFSFSLQSLQVFFVVYCLGLWLVFMGKSGFRKSSLYAS